MPVTTARPRTRRPISIAIKVFDRSLIAPQSLALAACNRCGSLLEFGEYNTEPRCCGKVYQARREKGAIRITVSE